MSQEQLQQIKQQRGQQCELSPGMEKNAAPFPTGGSGQVKKSQPGTGSWKSLHVQRAQTHYPQVFNRRAVRPVKVGISDDMRADAAMRQLPLTAKHIAWALASLTQTPCYLRAVSAGGPRYDLNGQACGEVTTEQQENARMLLVKLKAASKKKRVVQRVEA